MSDQSQGEGWWQASDGKWYPPEQAAGADATQQFGAPIPPTQPVGGAPFGPPTGPPTGPPSGVPTGPPPLGAPLGAPGGPPPGPPGAPAKSGLGKGPIIGIVVAALVVIGAIVFFATRDNGKKENASTSTELSTDSSTSSKSSSKKSSSSSSSSSSAKLPSGFKELSNSGEGVSIGVPSDFKEIDPSVFAGGASGSDFSSLNPELAPFAEAGNAFLQGAVLGATGDSSGTPAFLVVAKSPTSFDPTDSNQTAGLEAQLEGIGATNVTTKLVTLPAGKALRVSLSLAINTSSSSGTVNETLFFLNVGSTTWAIVGVSVGEGTTGTLFDQIAQTFAVTS